MIHTPEVTIGSGAFAIQFSCLIDAPRDMVYLTWVDPNNIPKWWGSEFLSTIVTVFDFKIGGLWRYVQKDLDGNIFGFHGVYHEILSPERLTFTYEYEASPGNTMLQKVEFHDQAYKTRILGTSVLSSFPDPDGSTLSDMREDTISSMNRFQLLIQDKIRTCNECLKNPDMNS